MALNFSHHSVIPSEDNMLSAVTNGLLAEGSSRDGYDGYVNRMFSDLEIGYQSEGNGTVGSQQSSKDILDLLPDDPFGMDISTTFTALTGWFEDLEVGYDTYWDGDDDGGGVKCNEVEYGLFDDFGYFWDTTMFYESNYDISDNGNAPNEVGAVISHGECSKSLSDDTEPFHSGLSFALSYLGVRDLLSVGMVCKALYFTVHSDPLLWRSIHIHFPLNAKITDGILLDLTSKSQGNLDCLNLVECPMITDYGLARVLENNPKLTKLSVPGCARLNVEQLASSIRAFNSKNTPGIKILRIGGLHGITETHFEELVALLGTDVDILRKQSAIKPQFYRRGYFYLSCDDDRAIDVELCPRCQKMRLVYDCPVESCKEKRETAEMCRACVLCIARCVRCGRCIHDDEYEETFSLEYICSTCWKEVMDADV